MSDPNQRPAPDTPSPAFQATTADAIVPSLDVQVRLDKGSDPDSPLAGLLAAAASVQGPLDESAYRRFLDDHGAGTGWPSAERLGELYGSFRRALQAAGIDGPA